MTEIRTKDKLFLAAVVPLALAIVYFMYPRESAVSKYKALQERDRVTVTHEEYPGQKRIRTIALREAQAAFAAEKEKKPPEPEVVGSADAAPARRTHDVVAVFREAGMRVVSVSLAQKHDDARASHVLRATLVRPAPVKRMYVIEGSYPSLKKALETFVKEKTPVVASSLQSAGDDRWKVEIHE